MSLLANVLRPYWVPGLNAVSGNVTKGIANWLAEERYQIYQPLTSKHFALYVADPEEYLAATAADVNRTAVAAYESIGQAVRNPFFPKSNAWILIKSYYAAFFAAHSILKMLGLSFATIESAQAGSLNKIAKIYGSWRENVAPGNFQCTYDPIDREILWRQVNANQGGVHERFWGFFKAKIDDLSQKILKSKAATTMDAQQVSAKLCELSSNLCFDSAAKGNWLSIVRNQINYKHQFGAWYPYAVQAPKGSVDERLVLNWRTDPMSIDLASHGDQYLRRFQETCSFIIGSCRILAIDMAERCPKGKSFHSYGWLAITRFAAQRGGPV